MNDQWVYAAAGGAFTLIVSLIGVVWWMLQKQIELLRESNEYRIGILREEFDRRFGETDQEIKSIRKRIHELVDRFSAVETGVKYGLFHKRRDSDA